MIFFIRIYFGPSFSFCYVLLPRPPPRAPLLHRPLRRRNTQRAKLQILYAYKSDGVLHRDINYEAKSLRDFTANTLRRPFPRYPVHNGFVSSAIARRDVYTDIYATSPSPRNAMYDERTFFYFKPERKTTTRYRR